MFPSSLYTSIDAPSVNWCGAHAISYALYSEQILLQTPEQRPHSHLNELFKAPEERAPIADLSQEEALENALLALGHTADESATILNDIQNILQASQNNNEISLVQIFQGYENTQGLAEARRISGNYECSVNALLGQRAYNELVTKLTNSWTELGIDGATQQYLLQEYSEVIATLREIMVFFDKHRDHGLIRPLPAQVLQSQLSPLLYHLYQKLALLPQEQGTLANHRHMLSAILGTPELADVFIGSVRCPITVHSARNPERMLSYQEGLQERFNLLQEIVQGDITEHISIRVPNGGMINVACEPMNQPARYPNTFKLSAQMTQEISRLLFKNDTLPEINTHYLFFAHDFDLFGGNTRYVIKNDDSHLKLLIRHRDTPNISQNFTRTNGFQVNAAPSGLSYFFGSLAATAKTLLKLAAFILTVYLFFKVCFSRSGAKISSTRLKPNKIPISKQAATSDYAPIEVRGILTPRKNLQFQKPRPPIPATLSRREQGRTHRK